MNPENGEIKPVPEGIKLPAKYQEFRLGERVEIAGNPFIICQVKNNRLILRSEKSPPTVKETRLLAQASEFVRLWQDDQTRWAEEMEKKNAMC